MLQCFSLKMVFLFIGISLLNLNGNNTPHIIGSFPNNDYPLFFKKCCFIITVSTIILSSNSVL